jgi:sugar lactone lactonase YvrE
MQRSPFRLKKEDLGFIGKGLNRPECVAVGPDGGLYASDWDGGVSRIHPDGRVEKIIAKELVHGEKLAPNGVFPEKDGSFLLTHLSQDHGGVYRLYPDGCLKAVLTEIDGVPLPPTNYALRDPLGRIWITVSSRLIPRFKARRPGFGDGFIAVLDRRGARIAADGIGFTNEIRFDRTGKYLYANETFGKKLSRYTVDGDGGLSDKQVVTDFGPGTFPDGLVQDEEECFWITGVFSNRIIRVYPDGLQDLVFEDNDPVLLADLEEKFQRGELAEKPLKGGLGTFLHNISSLAFGGADGKTAYLGCLDGESIAYFKSPVGEIKI